jgi:hypothetical protein
MAATTTSIKPATGIKCVGILQQNGPFSSAFPMFFRACLGNIIIFIYELLKKTVFRTRRCHEQWPAAAAHTYKSQNMPIQAQFAGTPSTSVLPLPAAWISAHLCVAARSPSSCQCTPSPTCHVAMTALLSP